ncbi:TolC family protein [Chitiniphilus shinanonensis]|nr:TolC family protein [Chitiniphilus shinanonensis]
MRGSGSAVLVMCLLAATAAAETLSFDAAVARLLDESDAIQAARYNMSARADEAEALKSLDLPTVSLDAQVLRYRKTIAGDAVSLDSVTVNGTPLPLNLNLPDVEAKLSQTSFRPTITALWPFYTGGKIDAAQRAAQAGVRQADAELGSARQGALVNLIQLYFGQQLAAKVLKIRADVRDGLGQHLDNARKLEQAGMITKAQRLQAQVAADTAQREYERALRELDSAQGSLARLLRSQRQFDLSTPLFMLTEPVGPRDEFLAAADANNPQVLKLQALGEAAQQKVRAEEARWLPEAFMFGSYNFNPDDAVPIEPDWIVGIGVRFPLFDRTDRKRSVSAAKAAGAQVGALVEEARTMLGIATHRAYNDVETAQQQFRLLASSLAAARENLRAQELAFREGQGTAVDVVDARLLLGGAQVEEAQAAYLFDVALARLLDGAGDLGRYPEFIRKADKVID